MSAPANEWTVLLRPRARKDLQKLPDGIRRRIEAALEELRQDPRRASNVKQLNRTERTFRKRVGDYRMLFEIDDAQRIVLVHRILHRSDAY